MPGIFDFANLQNLVEAHSPDAIVVVDTNLFMDNPEPVVWQTDINKAIFIVSYSVVYEIEKLRKYKNEPTKEKARKAFEKLYKMSEQGSYAKGKSINPSNFLITLKSPSQKVIDPELNKLGIVRDTVRDADSTLLLLHMELEKAFPMIPVTSVTGDKAYTYFGREFELLICNSQVFPLQLASLIDSRKATITIDPDKELVDAIDRIKNKTTSVELTLTGKKLDRDFKFIDGKNSSTGGIIAEGYGMLNHPTIGTRTFLWKLPYKPLTSKLISNHPFGGEPDLYDKRESNFGVHTMATLEFIGSDPEIPAALILALTKRISNYAQDRVGNTDSETKPLLQSPLCIIEYYMKTIFTADKWAETRNIEGAISEEELTRFTKNLEETWADPNVFNSYEALKNYFISELPKLTKDSMGDFLEYMVSVWNIGHTVRFSLPPDELIDAEECIPKQ